MPTFTNGGGLLLVCLGLLIAIWIGWYGHREWKQAGQIADQEERAAADRAAANRADDELVRWMNQGKP